MLNRIMTWAAIVGLVAALPFRLPDSYHLALQLLICVAAILVVLQALDMGKAWLALSFVVVAAIFNPVVMPWMARPMFLAINVVCLSLFLWSVFIFPRRPRLSIASITDRTPGSESL